MEIIKIVILSLSGLLLLFVGAMRLSNPINAFLKNSGIKLEKEVNLLNEIRSVSSVQLFGGIIILLGTFIPELTFTSFVIAILIFLGFAVGRFIGIAADGKPNKQIIQGIFFELFLGAANVFGLLFLNDL
ncbi:DUF4345 domain-containing protein [Leptobacterium flavescens]|uniref:DUF4345 domain-containing protein n=1 Tax=Leptobacterium flavescens TaxID=472055 RepID=A0A6P0USA1_9FLAO|nr:DUF4345 family protein [Leptobacterium flavescens]NER15390.1 DUF4345 domain-containing protein [Leptobacterium flavescens]